jgi:hypothetical protein
MALKYYTNTATSLINNILIQYTCNTFAVLNKVQITAVLQHYCRVSGDFPDVVVPITN